MTSANDADLKTCRELERYVDVWDLPTPVDLLGLLMAHSPQTFGTAILTTNFDPLIEVSLEKHRAPYYRTVLHNDGNLGQTVAEGTHVVHLHGYWHDYDTLHTPQQLAQHRPQLRRSLERVVESSTLVVIGYGGWDDVITRSLVELLSDSAATPEIMWAFHDADDSVIEASNNKLISILEPGIARGRVSLYRGIDCGSVLRYVTQRMGIGGAIKRDTRPFLHHPTPSSSDLPRSRSVGNFRTSTDSDRPVLVEPWVGRVHELGILATSRVPVVFVTGLGGQGKSGLAGKFLAQEAMGEQRGFDLWDWRDCREESERLNTQLLRIVDRLGGGAVDIGEIEVTDLRAIVHVLFRLLHGKKALLVFDNVDQYIDLETMEPVKGLDVLLKEAQTRTHDSVFIFTCRPDVHLDESRSLRIPLAGITSAETRDLLRASRVAEGDWVHATELHDRTDGHPLWVRLAAIQAVRHRDGLRGVLDLISKGGATLPDTTRSIWSELNDQQREVLRTMAELDRPEPESRLFDILPGRNANRISRALRALRSFHLIEERPHPHREPLLGLHPIIREFIISHFSKTDRAPYVTQILNFFGAQTVRFKELIESDPSYDILENWTRKAELHITLGDFEEAISVISEIAGPLVNRGYAEEMIRISMRLFDQLNWAEACSSYKDFDFIYSRCIKLMIEIGHDATDQLLSQYESSIPGKSSQFILLCDLRCYFNWFAGEYESAVQWGEEGRRLKESTSVDTAFSTTHSLALALRDSGRIAESIALFVEGESVAAVLKPHHRIVGKGAPFYGNIGRCLQFKEKIDDAMICYVKSARLLEEERRHKYRLNKGYIRLWIGQLLVRQNELELAAACFRAAAYMWSDSSPMRTTDAERELRRVVDLRSDLHHYVNESNSKVEQEYSRWLHRQ